MTPRPPLAHALGPTTLQKSRRWHLAYTARVRLAEDAEHMLAVPSTAVPVVATHPELP